VLFATYFFNRLHHDIDNSWVPISLNCRPHQFSLHQTIFCRGQYNGKRLCGKKKCICNEMTYIQAIGKPCVLEVRLPISDIRLDFATLNIMTRSLESRGFKGAEQNDSEVQLIVPVGPERITALHRSPSPEFVGLTRMTF